MSNQTRSGPYAARMPDAGAPGGGILTLPLPVDLRGRRATVTELLSAEIRAEDLPPAKPSAVNRGPSIIGAMRENVRRLPDVVRAKQWAVIGEFGATSKAYQFARTLRLECGDLGYEFAVREVDEPHRQKRFRLYARFGA